MAGPSDEIADRIEAALARIAASNSARADTEQRLRALEAVVERNIEALDSLIAAPAGVA